MSINSLQPTVAAVTALAEPGPHQSTSQLNQDVRLSIIERKEISYAHFRREIEVSSADYIG